MIGLDGIAVINVVSNPEEAAISRKKKLVTKITHNDGQFLLLVQIQHCVLIYDNHRWSMEADDSTCERFFRSTLRLYIYSKYFHLAKFL